MMDFTQMRSHLDGIAWPPMIGGEAGTILTLIQQLEETQWLSPAALQDGQFRQLARLAAHCAEYSASFAARLRAAGLQPADLATPAGLARLAPISRRAVRQAGPDFMCAGIPKAHGPSAPTTTSGSTSEPVTVQVTAQTQRFWLAQTMREHLWHERDPRARLAVIRALIPDGRQAHWGPPADLFFATGPFFGLPSERNISEQAAWLLDIDPHYLTTYPSNLAALLDHFERVGTRPASLREIRTMGETVKPGLRERTRAILGAAIADIYSSQENGVIALQCPVSGLYHLMSDSLLVEILDADGRPCPAGAVGRVVVTDLHNFASPLIRYDLDDHAEAGPPCPCGRGLPTVTRIVGRTRNMLRVGGDRRWPVIVFFRDGTLPPVEQFQLAQTALDAIEVRLAVRRDVTAAEEQRLAAAILDQLGAPFALRFVYFRDTLPAGPNGKREEFICEVPAPA